MVFSYIQPLMPGRSEPDWFGDRVEELSWDSRHDSPIVFHVFRAQGTHVFSKKDPLPYAHIHQIIQYTLLFL